MPALLTIVLLLALAAPSSAAAQSTELERRLGRLTAIGIPGAQVDAAGSTAVAGVADLAAGRPMRPGLSFRIGSVTKSFTATVALQLVAERRIRLSDSVERRAARPAVLRPPGDRADAARAHLRGSPTTREAGSDPLNVSLTNDPAVRARRFTPARGLVARVADEPLDFAPGTRVEYSNTNYVVPRPADRAGDGPAPRARRSRGA